MSDNEVKVGVDDTAYQNHLAEARRLATRFEANHIEWYWQMGVLFVQFSRDLDARKLPDRSVSGFIADLAESGYTIGQSTLYAARMIFLRFPYDQIPQMVERGVRVGHLKLMMPFYENERALVALNQHLYGADGKAVAVAELQKVCETLRRESAKQQTAERIEQVDRTAQAATSSPIYTSADDEEEAGGSAPVGADDEQTHLSPDPVPSGDGQTASRGLTKEKEFSVRPLTTLKKYDKTAVNLLAQISDMYTLVAEASKVGFDSDRAKKNFTDAFMNALASTKELLEPLQSLLSAMESAKDAI